MRTFFALLDLTAPLFVLIGIGYMLTRWGRWPLAAADAPPDAGIAHELRDPTYTMHHRSRATPLKRGSP